MPKKILVTGGAGFIGSHTVVELLNEGYEVVAIDNFSNSFSFVINNIKKVAEKEFHFEEMDAGNREELQNIFKKHPDISGVIHFAAFKAVGESVNDPLKYYENNVSAFVNLLDVMKKNSISNFVFSSSCTVYGEPNKLPVYENNHVIRPNSPYGNSKKICEEILEDLIASKTGFKAVALRYFNPIGAHKSALIGELPIGKPNNLIPFITQTAIGKRDVLTVFGNDYDTADGTCVRDYIHVVDLAKAHIKAIQYLENRKENNLLEVFNVGTGKGNTVLEVIKTFENVTDQTLNYQIGPRREGDVEAVYANTQKSKDILGWVAEHSLSDALKSAWNWEMKLKEKEDVNQ